MYGIFTYIYHKIQPNVAKYSIHEGCSKFLHVEKAIFARKKNFRQTFANQTFILAVHVGQGFQEEHGCVISSKLFPSDPLSHFILRQLHLNIYVLL